MQILPHLVAFVKQWRKDDANPQHPVLKRDTRILQLLLEFCALTFGTMAKTGPLYAGAAIWADHVGLALKNLPLGSRKDWWEKRRCAPCLGAASGCLEDTGCLPCPGLSG